MVESVTDCAIVMLDSEGRVVSWNTGAQRIKGYSAEEIVGQHFSRFYPPGDIARGAPQRDLNSAAAEGRFEVEGWRVRKDGSTFWANVVFTAILDQAGNARGFAKLTRDLTERRQVEQSLTRAKGAAEKANLAKSEFLSSMSHELRSPLNAILGFAQLMESDSTPATLAEKASIDEILRAGWYLLELINEILDLAQIESGKLSLSPEPTSLAEVILECQAMIEPQAQTRGIRMTFPHFDVPCFIAADRTRLKQVLINLLSKAIKYNQAGGTVVVDCAGSTAERIRLNVRDTGAGLPPEKLAQLFQPFNRLGQEHGAEQGTGIGLVMSKRLVELMGGVLGVESRVGEGSVFWCELGATAAPELEAKTVESAPIDRAQAQPGAPLRTLLYVEDNPANLKLVEQLIARRPTIRLLTAGDGNLGIQLARAHQPDVILMDINLPGISGIEALKILRDDPATAHIPIVALSANSSRISPSRSGSKSSWRRWTPRWSPCRHMVEVPGILKAKILVVDDRPANVLLLERMLGGAGYESVTSTLDPRAVCDLHEQNRYDLIVLDLQMPGMDGFQVMEGLKHIEQDGYLPVLVITAQPDHKLRALRAGAKDFISKPFDVAEVLTRVHNMLEVRLLHVEIRRKNDELKKLFDQVVAERKVSERLALHVAPDSIAARLQARPDVTADSFADVTVLIADVVGFSELIPAVSPEQLALLLDEIFTSFDGVAKKRGLRKIKTLGNSYMAAAGVPAPAGDHAVRAAHLSLDMIDALDRFNERSQHSLQVRIGIATGAVVAGVIGKRMYLYDVWGDAVTTASRMESHGVAGHVQVSESTRRLLGEPFLLEERGALEVEGKGGLKTWFVGGRNRTSD